MHLKRYSNLFRMNTVESKRGIKQEAIYTGDFYILDMPNSKEREYKTWLLINSFIIAFLFIYMGFLNNDGSRVFYVILPYVLNFLPIAYLIISTISFFPKNKLTVIQYDRTFQRIRTSGTGIIILSLASILGEIVYLIQGHANTLKMELIFLVCSIVVLIIAIMTTHIHSKIKFITVKNENTPKNDLEIEE